MIGLVVPAAGQGKRLGASKPKQFLEVAKKPLMVFTLERLTSCPEIDFVIIATSKSFVCEVEEIIEKFKIPKVHEIVVGGATRQESVFSGVKACPRNTQLLFVHDAVRPFVPKPLISKLLSTISYYDGVIPGIPVRDALNLVRGSQVVKNIPREGLFHIQTPQLSKFSILKSCLEEAEKRNLDFPDESSLLLYFGYKVGIVKGSFLNFKVTYPEDFCLAETLINCKIEALLDSEEGYGSSMDK